MTDSPHSEGVKLTKAQRRPLAYILREGPGTLPMTARGRVTAAVTWAMENKLLEPLNRLRPGPPMYEITTAGRLALQSGNQERGSR